MKKKSHAPIATKRKKTTGLKDASEAKKCEEGWVPPSDDDSWRPNGACCDDEGYRRRATSAKALKTFEMST